MSSIKRHSTEIYAVNCYNFLYSFKGAPSARHADRHTPRLADARDVHAGRELARQCYAVAARV